MREQRTTLLADGRNAGVKVRAREGQRPGSGLAQSKRVRGVDGSREGDVLIVGHEVDGGGALEAGRPIRARALALILQGAAAEIDVSAIAQSRGVFRDQNTQADGGGPGIVVIAAEIPVSGCRFSHSHFATGRAVADRRGNLTAAGARAIEGEGRGVANGRNAGDRPGDVQNTARHRGERGRSAIALNLNRAGNGIHVGAARGLRDEPAIIQLQIAAIEGVAPLRGVAEGNGADRPVGIHEDVLPEKCQGGVELGGVRGGRDRTDPGVPVEDIGPVAVSVRRPGNHRRTGGMGGEERGDGTGEDLGVFAGASGGFHNGVGGFVV